MRVQIGPRSSSVVATVCQEGAASFSLEQLETFAEQYLFCDSFASNVSLDIMVPSYPFINDGTLNDRDAEWRHYHEQMDAVLAAAQHELRALASAESLTNFMRAKLPTDGMCKHVLGMHDGARRAILCRRHFNLMQSLYRHGF
jgi:hypothetical protein